MDVLIITILMVMGLSILTTYEVIALKNHGFDIIAQLQGHGIRGRKQNLPSRYLVLLPLF